MSKRFEDIVLYEIRENRKAINRLDKDVYSNKLKLSIFVGAMTLFFSIGWAILFEKIKTFI